MASSFTTFLDHTPQPVGLLWTSNQPHAVLYLTTHNTHNRQTSMPPVGFEPTISAGERLQTYAMDPAATWTGLSRVVAVNILPDRSSVGCKWKQKKTTRSVVVCRKETPRTLRHPGRPTRACPSWSSKLYTHGKTFLGCKKFCYTRTQKCCSRGRANFSRCTGMLRVAIV